MQEIITVLALSLAVISVPSALLLLRASFLMQRERDRARLEAEQLVDDVQYVVKQNRFIQESYDQLLEHNAQLDEALAQAVEQSIEALKTRLKS